MRLVNQFLRFTLSQFFETKEHTDSVLQVVRKCPIEATGFIIWYTANGAEGNTLTFIQIPNIKGKTVVAVNRESYELKPVTNSPTVKDFAWDIEYGILTFGSILQAQENIKITYR